MSTRACSHAEHMCSLSVICPCAGTAPLLHENGFWVEDAVDEFDTAEGDDDYPAYYDDDRELQFKRLAGHGDPPQSTELAALPWPQREWWKDRDRIVLLHEFVEAWPPMGHFMWETDVAERAQILWGACSGEGRFANGSLSKIGWESVEAPGMRMLASFPCCPRFLRPPMGGQLFATACQPEPAEKPGTPNTDA